MNLLKPDARIGVLMGGCSSERDISLKSGHAVFQALQEKGCDCVELDLQTTQPTEILTWLKSQRVDIVFNVLHGKFGEDGEIQMILDRAGVIYTGCGPQASRLAMDKAATQTLLQQQQILVPEFVVLKRGQESQLDAFLKQIQNRPVVVKPTKEGSSIGITMVREMSQLSKAVEQAFAYGPEVIIEEYIPGREVTSAILGGEALPLVEIRPKGSFFDFTSKYQKGMSEYLVPAPLAVEITERIQQMSAKAFELIGARDMARSDFMVDQNGRAYLLEINTIPGFTATSLLPMAAQCAGLSFGDLCLKIVGFASTRMKVYGSTK